MYYPSAGQKLKGLTIFSVGNCGGKGVGLMQFQFEILSIEVENTHTLQDSSTTLSYRLKKKQSIISNLI